VARPFLFGVHWREVIFREPDRNGWRRPSLAGTFAGNSRHGSVAEFAGGFGLLKTVCDNVLIFRPPFGLLRLGVGGWLFLGRSGSLLWKPA
jgi:hypothetical protein